MTHEKEINLDELFHIILRGKKKIIIITIISIFFAIGFYKMQPAPAAPSTKSITKIKRLNKNQLVIFEFFNSLDIYNINSELLYSNYHKILQERTAFKKAIEKFEIISKKNYENNEKYEEALTIASYKMAIGSDGSNLRQDAAISISLEGTNKKKSLEIIKYIKDENNRLSIKNIEQQLRYKILILKKFDEIKKANIKIKIQDRKDEYDLEVNKILQDLKSKIEDVDSAIKNSIYDKEMEIIKNQKDYKNRTSIRLQYLEEQAAIARKLKIKNLVDGLGLPFYLRGYLAIEKEIQLIKNRKYILPYASEQNAIDKALFKKKRRLEQDQSVARKEMNKLYLREILILEKELIDIDRNNDVYSASINIFNETLVELPSDFESVIFDPYSTIFERGENNPGTFSKILVLAIFLGLIIGLFYIIIEEKIKKAATTR